MGGPSTVAGTLAAYIGDCRLDALDVSFQVPGLAVEEADQAMAMFAREVMPQVRSLSHKLPSGSIAKVAR
ncbi:hypothetical protein [Amycolatopsis jiangsuensis]|uniref:Luciferase-like monooxygenase n=1 Tax=Amycolatopsis jiangsuensis TaxID=1181879 RepID=A0A840IR33_9PSEU|nr:hypothetical protein [Amycolatopsis jiangsuensis]MBB4684350.1 hypothetical protein [Amycolatopsis jiangsuensis]